MRSTGRTRVKDFDKEPGGFVYALAENYSTIKYFSHDSQGSDIPLQSCS